MEREKVLDKIRKLMAKAADPCNVHEAAAAAEAAQRLMLIHRIEESDVSVFSPQDDDPITDIDLLLDSGQKSSTSWQQILLGAIARSCFCRLIITTSSRARPGRLQVYGRRSDLDAVTYLYRAFINQINDLCESWVGAQNHPVERRDRNSFRYGAACTIADRMRATRRAHEQSFPSSTALVPLRRAEDEVNDHVRRHVGHLVSVTHRGASSWDGYLAGKIAGAVIPMGGTTGALGQGMRGLPAGVD